MTSQYKEPKILSEWTQEVPGGELFRLMVLDNRTVRTDVGPYAHSSGSSSCTWMEFLNGSLHGVTTQEFGPDVLQEALAYVRSELATPSYLDLSE